MSLKFEVHDNGSVTISADTIEIKPAILSRHERAALVIDSVISAYDEYQEIRRNGEAGCSYFEQACVVNIGRQCGASAYIMNNADLSDVVIVFGKSAMLSQMTKIDKLSIDSGKLVARKLSPAIHAFSIDSCEQTHRCRGKSFGGRTIWIDNAGWYRTHYPAVYNTFVQNITPAIDINTRIIELG